MQVSHPPRKAPTGFRGGNGVLPELKRALDVEKALGEMRAQTAGVAAERKRGRAARVVIVNANGYSSFK